jgi:hypothetical protein
MSREAVDGVAGLEQAKIAEGHYLIEGWDVRRLTQRRWRAARFGEVVTRQTLAEIKEAIWRAN